MAAGHRRREARRRMKSDELLRRLALNDEATVRRAVTDTRSVAGALAALEPKTAALVHLAALLAVGAPSITCRPMVERARAAGASDDEIVAVLVAVAPAIGAAGVVAAAPRLALAVDYELEEIDRPWCDDRDG